MHAAGAGAFFVEPLQPDLPTFAEVLFLTTVGNFFLAPFVRPFSWRRIFFTCVLPVNIFTIAFDGIVSVFKSKTAAAYRKLLEDGSLDRCGVTLLAGKAVGAPFVGATAATIVIAEVLRLLHGGPVNRLVELNLVNPDHRRATSQRNDFSRVNPGFVPVAGDG